MFVATFQVRPPYLDFALAAAAVALIVLSARRSRRLWSEAAPPPEANGSRRAGRVVAAFTAAALVALAATAAVMATSQEPSWQARFGNWHLVVAAALYFPWALLQQYIFQFYWLGRWLVLVPVPLAIAFTAVGFAAVHFPRWPVMLVTLVAGAVWSFCYYRWRALLPLAVSHAVLGTALHYWVFGRDLLEAWLPG